MMRYFAYGSNMCTRRLQDRAPSARYFDVAQLHSHQLSFRKAGKDGSAKCDAAATGHDADKVYGVVFEIDPTEKDALDRCESLGHGYAEKMVELDGREGPLTAFTYIAQPEYIDSGRRPYSWYKDFVLGGAREHGLPADYIATIESVAADEDPDPVREARARKLLPCDNGLA